MIALPVLRIDSTFVAVHKPAGRLSVPGRGALAPGSVAQEVQAHHSDALVVHRLDMATSGVMLMGRGADAQRALSRQFASRTVAKRYIAVVNGLMRDDEGEIDLPLSADWPNRPRQRVDATGGKPSLTRYEVLARDEAARRTRVRLEPVTGRSHQLRVHLLALGNPVLGDALYAPDLPGASAPRLMLHAERLAFLHPRTGGPVCIDCPAPF